MSSISDLQNELQETSAAVARAERIVASHPEIPSALATLLTIQARKKNLEEQFAAAADELGLDICSYRIEFEDRHRATISSLTMALNTFQKVFTHVYDALVNGPKQRSRINDEIINATSFGFGYTFPGSVGFMMTLANDRLLLGETKLDDAMKKTLELISVRTPEEVQDMTQEVGLVSVRFAHQWAIENQKGGLGADIIWQRQEDVKLHKRVQPQEIVQMARAISSSIAEEEIKFIGELRNVNTFEQTFEMIVGEKKITGSYRNAITESNPAQLPKKYLATLTTKTKVALVDGQEEVTYFLVKLENPPSSSVLEISDLTTSSGLAES